MDLFINFSQQSDGFQQSVSTVGACSYIPVSQINKVQNG